ncbi:hypothetical protein GCM10027447_25500 [Glycomyces halotolerans]
MTRRAGSGGHWDPGLQPERNSLAWQRTALGLTAALAVAARLLAAPVPWLGIVLPIAGLIGGVSLFATAGIRSCRLERRLRATPAAGPPPVAPGGRLLLVTALLATALAGAGAFLILAVLGR